MASGIPVAHWIVWHDASGVAESTLEGENAAESEDVIPGNKILEIL